MPEKQENGHSNWDPNGEAQLRERRGLRSAPGGQQPAVDACAPYASEAMQADLRRG